MIVTMLSAVLGMAPVHAAPTVSIGQPLRGLALPLSDTVTEALQLQEWEDALTALRAMDPTRLSPGERADWAFLVAWCATRGGDAARAEDVLDQLAPGTSTAPEAYVRVAQGAVLHALGRNEAAVGAFDGVEPGDALYATASLSAAEALRALDREDEAMTGEPQGPVGGVLHLLAKLGAAAARS